MKQFPVPAHFVILGAFLIGTALFASDPNTPTMERPQPPALRFNNFSTDHGLSQSSVYAMVQDNDGILWFGTEDGLNKYDGYTIKVYRHNPNNPRSLPDNLVVYLLKDLDGAIWLAGDSGVGRYHAETDDFQAFHPGGNASQPNQISSMALQGREALWVSGFRGGLYRLDLKTLTFEDIPFDPEHPERQKGNWVRTLTIDHQQNIWMGSMKGLNRLDPKTLEWSLFEHDPQDPNSLCGNEIRSLFVDRRGRLWVGSSNGLNLMDGEGQTFRRFQPGLTPGMEDGWINVIGEDREGRLWIGTRTGGLALLDQENGRFTTYRHNANLPYSICSDNILCFLTDPSGMMWVGGYLSGVSSAELKPNPFGLYHAWSDRTSLSDGRVRAIWETTSGDLWVGTMNGLNLLPKGNEGFIAFHPDPEDPGAISESQVMSMVETPDGTLWFGSYHGGVSRLDPGSKRFRTYKFHQDQPHSLPHDVVSALHLDSKNRLWLGTRLGLAMYRRDQDDFLRHSLLEDATPGKISPEVLSMDHDGDRTLWAGTDASGVIGFDQETGQYRKYIHQEDDPNTLASNAASAVLLESKHLLWVGGPVGLGLLDTRNGHVRRFDFLPLIGHSNVRALLHGEPDSLWLSTNHGLIQLNTKEETTRAFDFHDGLQGNEFIRGSAFRAQDGRLYFGGTRGLSFFYPGGLEKRTWLPSTAVTSVEIFGEEKFLDRRTGELGTITLKPHQKYISLEFAALDFARPDKNHHAYQMEGFDAHWVETGARRFVSFTNLDPGSYQFRVKGTNSDGLWSDRITTLSIQVLPPFWATWWFRVLALMTVIGGLLAAHLLRVRNMARTSRELQARVEEKTAALAHAQGELMELARKAGMAEISTGVLHNIGNLFNSVNVSVESLQAKFKQSKIGRLADAMNLLRDNREDLPGFFAGQKGPILADYLIRLGEIIRDESASVNKELMHLEEGLHLIREEIAGQQQYAGAANPLEIIALHDFLQDALVPFQSVLDLFGINARVICDSGLVLRLPRARLLNVIGLLIRNAEEAMHEAPHRELILSGRNNPDGDLVVTIADTGPGVPVDLAERIFSHGFSTKGNRGVGLHVCANTMRELGGSLRLLPMDETGGAKFEIVLPAPKENHDKT